jgi:hypothetical protein
MICKGAQTVIKGSQIFHKEYTIPNHTNYSREDPKPLVTTSLAIMIVVHTTEVSTLYPRVVISSLIGD